MNSRFQLYYIGVLSRDPRDLGTLVLSFQESGIVGVLGLSILRDMCHFDFIEFYEPLKNESSFFTVEIDEELEGANMVASSCNSQETVVDSGVDSEATTPSSPEDEASEETEKSSSKEESALSNDEMVLETAETLLALSGKKPTGTAAASSQKDTAVVLPQQPQDDAKGSTPLLRLFSMFYVPMRTSRAM